MREYRVRLFGWTGKARVVTVVAESESAATVKAWNTAVNRSSIVGVSIVGVQR